MKATDQKKSNNFFWSVKKELQNLLHLSKIITPMHSAEKTKWTIGLQKLFN
jgi:hypothetical protein